MSLKIVVRFLQYLSILLVLRPYGNKNNELVPGCSCAKAAEVRWQSKHITTGILDVLEYITHSLIVGMEKNMVPLQSEDPTHQQE